MPHLIIPLLPQISILFLNLYCFLSSHALTSDKKPVLDFGLNFSQSFRPSIPEIIAFIQGSFEICKTSSAQKEALRSLITDTIAADKRHTQSNLISAQKRALLDLKYNNDFVFTEGDKSGKMLHQKRVLMLIKPLSYQKKALTLKTPTDTQFSKLKK